MAYLFSTSVCIYFASAYIDGHFFVRPSAKAALESLAARLAMIVARKEVFDSIHNSVTQTQGIMHLFG
eukprot:1983084-Amphidinium_carterae.1